MPQKDNNSIWIEGIDPQPKQAPRKRAPKQTPFEKEFGDGKRMPLVPNVQKQLSKRMSKA